MPTFNDYSADDDENAPQSTGGGGAPSAIAPGSGSRATAPTKQESSTFVPWERFVSANKSVSDRNAGKLQADTQSQVNAASDARKQAGAAFGAKVESQYDHAPAEKPSQPWGSFLGPQPQAKAAGDAGQSAPPAADGGFAPKAGPQAIRGEADDPGVFTRTGVSATADASGVPKDLEESMGKGDWESLVGQTVGAESNARALGSEGGVQGLIQKGNVGASVNSGLDAALLNQAGGKAFGATSKEGTGLTDKLGATNKNAQQEWAQLSGDTATRDFNDRVSKENADRQAKYDSDTAAYNKAQEAGAPGAEPAGWHPDDYGEDFKSFLDPEINDASKFGQFAHEGAMYASPADWITRGLGELGYNGENASQLFAKVMGGSVADGNKTNTWQLGNLRSSVRMLQNEYGPEAMQFWWKHMTPQMWQAYQDLGNAGAQSREIRAWLESAGFKKGAQHNDPTGGSGTPGGRGAPIGSSAPKQNN